MMRFTIGSLCFLMILQYSFSCVCNANNSEDRRKGETDNFNDGKEKRHLEIKVHGNVKLLPETEVEYETVPNIADTNHTMTESKSTTTEGKTDAIENTTASGVKEENTTSQQKTEDNQTTVINTSIKSSTSEIEETTFVIDMDTETPNHCKKYKPTERFNIHRMADVWKVALYTMTIELKCFKLHIKALSTSDQEHLAKMYGDFDEKVHWNNITLEINSTENKSHTKYRKHFLQSTESQFGVMDNIIIDRENTGSSMNTVLREEEPDQWLVVKNLLLMRDCSTGDLVVFSRVPSSPRIVDIEEALEEFGETGPINGTRACDDPAKVWVKVNKWAITDY